MSALDTFFQFLPRINKYISDCQGRKKNLLALACGISLTLALPPLHILPFAVFGFCGFFLLIIACNSRKDAFKTGWWFGLGHFVTGLYWIAFALLVDIADFGWLIPFAVLGIPACIAIYTGIVAVITWQARKYFSNWRLVIVFAVCWTIIEMLRGWLFTGFPWNLAGYIWAASDNMLQLTSITGIWGLSLVTALCFTMPAIMLRAAQGNARFVQLLPLVFALITLSVIYIWGAHRLSAVTQFTPNVKLRLVQANIPQNMKWEEEWRYETVRQYLEMSSNNASDEITHIIWPETALPFVISEDSPLLGVVAKIIPTGGALITGALRAEYSNSGALTNMWNSMIVVNKEGKLHAHYDKSHLVPFGEYVPLRSILPLEKITHGNVDFASGDGAKTINAPGLPLIGGLVCYEVIFPGQIIEQNHPPAVIINVTNDAWYGNTSGPYQHFQMARIRAIEEGTPLVRAANNGISAVVDAYGRIIAKTALGSTTILDAYLPTKIAATTYSSYGSRIVLLIMAMLMLIALYRHKNSK